MQLYPWWGCQTCRSYLILITRLVLFMLFDKIVVLMFINFLNVFHYTNTPDQTFGLYLTLKQLNHTWILINTTKSTLAAQNCFQLWHIKVLDNNGYIIIKIGTKCVWRFGMFNVIVNVKHALVTVSTSVSCLQAYFSLQQSYRQTSGRVLQQHPDQETPAESRTGTRNIYSQHSFSSAGGRWDGTISLDKL